MITELQLEGLIEKVANGTSIRELAKQYGIPFSTLRDRLNRHRKKDINKASRLRKAVQDVMESGISYRKASEKHGISKSTIFDYVKRTKEKNSIS
ncbi:MAG: helix-turn-helix domain-containing protein [Xenococcaceae cyanobacterium]